MINKHTNNLIVMIFFRLIGLGRCFVEHIEH